MSNANSGKLARTHLARITDRCLSGATAAAASLALAAAMMLMTGGAVAPAYAADEIVLKAVTFLPTSREKMKIKGLMLVDRINQLAAQQAPGRLKIQVLGGPEVIPSANQPIAVRTGTVDIALTCASFYEGLVPVGDIIMLSQVSLEKERQSGALAYVRELHERSGFFALGRMDGTREPFFYVGTTKPVQKPADLKGLRAGSISLFAEAFSRALGMTFQVMPFGDTYTAMENGVIDVYTNALDTQSVAGLSKLKGYLVVDHPVFIDNCIAIVNLAKWRTLPAHPADHAGCAGGGGGQRRQADDGVQCRRTQEDARCRSALREIFRCGSKDVHRAGLLGAVGQDDPQPA